MNQRIATPAEHDLDVLRSYSATRAKPSREACENSALCWLTLAQETTGRLGHYIDSLPDSPERDELVKLRDRLRREHSFVRAGLTEAGAHE